MLKTPPMQTATATIDTLCGRLESATLLEDRRAAILGLRSVAKQYPASVASGSLRELIATLKRDGLGEASATKSQDGESRKSQEGGGDVDTIRLVLETLLMLFNPDSNSPEAGDEIAFFLADEFSMRQDNITLLLNLLDPTSPYADYYSRLYAVQLLSGICAARPERLQECILSAPLGISRIVGILDDARDAVRNAGLLLLVDLTGGANEDLRKIVAFEDVFGKVFALIELEGGLAEAGITAQDCLSLLANLIKGSSSNQTMFRESGCVSQLAHLLTQAFPPESQEAAFVSEGREKAAWGLLQLLRLFLVPGEASTPQNQTAFFRAGAAQILINLGFSPGLPPRHRACAFKAACALIKSNPPIQEQFAALTVVTPADAEHNAEQAKKQQQPNGTRPKSALSNRNSARPSVENRRTYIIEALLDLSLDQSQAEQILRSASCGLVQAYLFGHDRIKAHFLQRAVAGHAEHETAANVLNTLLHPPEADISSVLFASFIVQDLVSENLDAKTALTAVKEGNEEEGEDVITSIQALGSQLSAALQTPIDERLMAAYSSLLTTLLWDFAPGVDDLLADGSSLLQSLVAVVKTPSDPIVAGLAAVLLGTVYEFSTKDSPIPRRTLAPLLQQKLGRTKYLDALLQLRREPAVRDFDLDVESDEDSDALLSKVYVELYAVEYSRLRKAVDKDPGVEVLPPSAAEAGVDRDVLDDLRQQLQTAKDALAQAQQEAIEANQKGEQDRMTAGKELQTANSEVERLRKINQAMQQSHEGEIQKLQKQNEQQRQTNETRHQHALNDAKKEAERKAQETMREKEAASTQKIQEHERRIAELGNAHRSEASGHANVKQQLETLTGKHNEVIVRERDLSRQVEDLKRQYAAAEKNLQAATARATGAESKLEVAKKALDTRGEEVEKLKSEISELKADLQGKEDELKTERAGFADLEKELEAAKGAATAAEAKAKAAEDAQKKAGDKSKPTEDKLKAAEGKVKSTEEKLKTAEGKVKSTEDKLKTAEGKVKSAEDKLKSAEDKLKTSEQKLKTAEEKLKSSESSAKKDSGKGGKGGNKNNQADKADKADKEKLEKLEAELKDAKESEKAAKEDLEKLQNKVKEAQDNEKASKEELESMLLVMGDIESKRDEYRAKVKELGGEVSEDEDDDEDEDEDEEDEDDVE